MVCLVSRSARLKGRVTEKEREEEGEEGERERERERETRLKRKRRKEEEEDRRGLWNSIRALMHTHPLLPQPVSIRAGC